MSEQQTKMLKAEKLPEAVSVRRPACSAARSMAGRPVAMRAMAGRPVRQALGRGLGTLLLRERLAASAGQMSALRLPAWAVGWEPPFQAFLKKVMTRADGKRFRR